MGAGLPTDGGEETFAFFFCCGGEDLLVTNHFIDSALHLKGFFPPDYNTSLLERNGSSLAELGLRSRGVVCDGFCQHQ